MIKNLVFSASGSKIFIHLGFLKYLGDNNLLDTVDTFVGCSGGSIMALIISLGYDLKTITELFLKLDSEKLKKIDTDSVLNFFDNYGLDNGNNMERALRIILKTQHGKETISFKELFETYGKRLIICSVNLQKHQEEFFDYLNNPDMDVITAVLMSLSIPIMFSPREFNNDLYVDGGLICPYPINIIEIDDSIKRDETLGIVMSPQYCISKDNVEYEFVFCNKDLVQHVEINTFEKYLFSVLSCGSIKLLKERYDKYKDISVLVVNDQNGLNFEVNRSLREDLIQEGYNYTKHFFEMKQRKIEEDNIKLKETNSDEANSDEANSDEANSDEANSDEANSEEANSDEANSDDANSEEANSEDNLDLNNGNTDNINETNENISNDLENDN
jgi:hypothetical protein